MIRISDLRHKDIVNRLDGKRLGFIKDIELDLTEGKIKAIVLPGESRMFSFLGRIDDIVVDWQQVQKIGVDVILVDLPGFATPQPEQEAAPKAKGRLAVATSGGDSGVLYEREPEPPAAPATPIRGRRGSFKYRERQRQQQTEPAPWVQEETTFAPPPPPAPPQQRERPVKDWNQGDAWQDQPNDAYWTPEASGGGQKQQPRFLVEPSELPAGKLNSKKSTEVWQVPIKWTPAAPRKTAEKNSKPATDTAKLHDWTIPPGEWPAEPKEE